MNNDYDNLGVPIPKPDGIDTLGDALPREIARCQELLTFYAEIGPAGNFASAMIRHKLSLATLALIEGDCVAMIAAYQELKGCE